MKKRYHCEYKKCKCIKFYKHCKSLCLVCKHAKLWHSKKAKISDLSFNSPRESARKPTYTYVSPIQIAIFVPEAPDIPPPDIIYCLNVELLPI
jgi:hypothetical protein